MANDQAGHPLSDWYGYLAHFACWAAVIWLSARSCVKWLLMHFPRMRGEFISAFVGVVLMDSGNGLVSTERVHHPG